MAAKPPLSLTGVGLLIFRILDGGVVNSDMFFTLHRQRAAIARQVDGIAPAACRFAADGAIATHERIGLVTIDPKVDSTTVAGTF